jgi:capsular polysaccharide biosynthesis protein
MAEPFEAREYAAYLRRRWGIFAAAGAAAAALALAASFALPKRYTALVRIVIEPGEPVSAAYLESLRTYAAYAASDEIFAGAAEKFHLASSQKDKILSVVKPEGARILEIRATLGDAKEALDVARYIASQTVELNRSLDAAYEGGDRLEILDHGAIPAAPAAPKTARNVEAAVLIAWIATLVGLSARFR